MNETFLTIRNVTKSFGNFVALRDISLEIYQGEFICFLGPSGCGKTTLLRIIAGLETQESGQIIQAGKDISRLPPAKRDFGIVFQSYALFPNLTAERNIAYGLENNRMKPKQIQARVAELLALVGLSSEGKKYPAQLSGGQQQRVALARALALSPGLLLLDEPLSALDARVRANLRQELKLLQRQLGITTIMVTHDQEEALTMADRIVVMDHGVIHQVGAPLEIYRNPQTPFVANFIGVMNFIESTVTDKHTAQLGNYTLHVPALHDGAGKVKLAIRPEDITSATPPNTPNTLPTTIQHVQFLGSFFRLILQVDGTEKKITADFSIHETRHLDLSESAPLHIQFPPDLLRVYHD